MLVTVTVVFPDHTGKSRVSLKVWDKEGMAKQFWLMGDVLFLQLCPESLSPPSGAMKPFL